MDHYKVGYRINFGGTPIFASAECIMAQLMTEYCHIIDLLVRFGLFKNNSSAENILNSTVDTTHITLRLEVKHLVTTISYRIATYKAVIFMIKEIMLDANTGEVHCVTHGFIKAYLYFLANGTSEKRVRGATSSTYSRILYLFLSFSTYHFGEFFKSSLNVKN